MDLNINLEKNTSYLNSWNILSKLLWIKPLINENSISNWVLIIVSNEKILNNFLKIWEYLDIKINKLLNINDLVSLIFNKTWVYIVTKELFNIKIPNTQYLEKNLSIEIKKWLSINQNEIIKKLNDFWYKFNESQLDWTYKVAWDTLNITDFSWQNNYKISFWWDKIEDILVFSQFSKGSTTIVGMDYKNIDNIYIWKNDIIDFLDETDSLNLNLIEKINTQGVFCVFDCLDFYKYYDELITANLNFINFNSISSNTLNHKQINLNITEVFLEKIKNLKN